MLILWSFFLSLSVISNQKFKTFMKKLFIFLTLFTVKCLSFQNYPELVDFEEVEINQTSEFSFKIESATAYKIDSIIVINQYYPSRNNAFEISDQTSDSNFETEITVSFTPTDNIKFSGIIAIYYRRSHAFQDTFSVPGLISIALNGMGRLPENLANYYAGSQNAFAKDLFDILNESISEHTEYSYRDAREFMYESHDNRDGKLFCVYTDRSIDHTDGIPNVQETRFNTEHTWPQSKGSDNEPERSDMHHIFPTYEVANSTRASYIFDNIDDNITWEENGSKLGTNSDGEIAFEVRDEQKGNSARAMMYFATKYGNYENYIDPMNQVLREWNEFDKPDEREFQRNDDIFSVQENRNPFIDNWRFANRFKDFQDFEDPRDSNQIVILVDTIYTYFYEGIIPVFYYGIENLEITLNLELCDDQAFSSGKEKFELKAGDMVNINISVINFASINESTHPEFDNEGCIELIFSDGTKKKIVVFFDDPTSVKYDANYLPHPNPATDFISINPEAKNIDLQDQVGNNFEANLMNGKLDISKLSTGIYLIKYEINGKKYYAKFVKY